MIIYFNTYIAYSIFYWNFFELLMMYSDIYFNIIYYSVLRMIRIASNGTDFFIKRL
ncbi:MAG: hypothetical protein BWY90_01330 [Deltaproteobacteria bacterium ADurb.BinA014]|nr:MAG: hypothetical protein BWY90_01330 [Deltaproteobacteria bacterium ADurb.BinA014]